MSQINIIVSYYTNLQKKKKEMNHPSPILYAFFFHVYIKEDVNGCKWYMIMHPRIKRKRQKQKTKITFVVCISFTKEEELFIKFASLYVVFYY